VSIYSTFLQEFARSHHSIGAVAPSSRFLATEMLQGMALGAGKVVVEYGPGTGSFTSEIVSQLASGAKFVAIERNAAMAELFRSRFPEVRLVEDSVETLPDVLSELGESGVDCVISGLPWAAFTTDLQDRLLTVTHNCLREGGRFATFAYVHGLLLPQGRRFRRLLIQKFSSVSRSRVVLRNLPPAFVYRCTK
jgi:phospholipid N-methyltransferase